MEWALDGTVTCTARPRRGLRSSGPDGPRDKPQGFGGRGTGRPCVDGANPTGRPRSSDALAIKAETAACFLTQELLIKANLTDATKLALYNLYFEAMRAGHAGQALGLSGLEDAMPSAVASGESSPRTG